MSPDVTPERREEMARLFRACILEAAERRYAAGQEASNKNLDEWLPSVTDVARYVAQHSTKRTA